MFGRARVAEGEREKKRRFPQDLLARAKCRESPASLQRPATSLLALETILPDRGTAMRWCQRQPGRSPATGAALVGSRPRPC